MVSCLWSLGCVRCLLFVVWRSPMFLLFVLCGVLLCVVVLLLSFVACSLLLHVYCLLFLCFCVLARCSLLSVCLVCGLLVVGC